MASVRASIGAGARSGSLDERQALETLKGLLNAAKVVSSMLEARDPASKVELQESIVVAQIVGVGIVERAQQRLVALRQRPGRAKHQRFQIALMHPEAILAADALARRALRLPRWVAQTTCGVARTTNLSGSQRDKRRWVRTESSCCCATPTHFVCRGHPA